MIDPNATVPLPKYMTYIEDRSPSFKVHDTLGQVKTAIIYHVNKIVPGRYYNPKTEGATCKMIAYELNGTSYDLMWTIHKGMRDEDLPWTPKRKKPYVPPVSTRNCTHVGCSCNSH